MSFPRCLVNDVIRGRKRHKDEWYVRRVVVVVEKRRVLCRGGGGGNSGGERERYMGGEVRG